MNKYLIPIVVGASLLTTASVAEAAKAKHARAVSHHRSYTAAPHRLFVLFPWKQRKEVVPAGKHRTARHVKKPPRHSATKVAVAAHPHKKAHKHATTHRRSSSHHARSHARSHTSARRTVHHHTAVASSVKQEKLPWTPGPNGDSVISGAAQLIVIMKSELGKNPTGWSRQWCGRYLDMTLRRAGYNGGGNLARSYASYGKPTPPRVGAIAVMPHHVGIVTGVGPDYVTLISGNHGRKVGIGKYSMKKIMAFRMAI